MNTYESRNALLARRAAEESIVLIRNENHALPLESSGKIAMVGIGAVRTIRGGTGSGDPFNAGNDKSIIHINQSERYHINLMTSFEQAGYEVVNAGFLNKLAEVYDYHKENFRGSMMQTFVSPEEELTEKEVSAWAAETDTVLMVISRTSGEGRDRDLVKEVEVDGVMHVVGDYSLSPSEKENLRLIRSCFRKVIVVLNVGGVIDMEAVEEQHPDAVVLLGQAGQEGGAAAVRVLNGTVNPSGRLSDTWAKSYSDYPASATFANNDGDPLNERYTEGIYVGYRYFQSFGIRPRYAFGYGLSYTDFAVSFDHAEWTENGLQVSYTVENTGTAAGKEVVQLYVHKPETVMEMPYLELAAFAKSRLLEPGEKQDGSFTLSVEQLSAYDETTNCYVLSEGTYVFRMGKASDTAENVFVLQVDQRLVISRHDVLMPLQEELSELHHPAYAMGGWEDLPVVVCPLDHYDTVDYTACYEAENDHPEGMPARAARFEELLAGSAEAKEIVASFSDDQIASFMAGIGYGGNVNASTMVGTNAKSVPGAAGETTSDLIVPYGIPNMVVADGPAGLRVRQEYDETLEDGTVVHRNQHSTAWPVGTVLAQSFDTELIYEVGCAMADEMSAIGVDMILGPGLNIHRDPLCGRNFEYFSEDPLISGEITAAITRGVQSTGRASVCIKHFAVNNQETQRSRSNSIVSQRALREIYLKGFEIAVRKARPLSIMTAYNLVNGVYTPESHDLCTKFARNEWGFDGFIMTDWNGGRKQSQFLRAGNDLMMPGGSGKVMKVLLELRKIDPEFTENGMVLMKRAAVFSGACEDAWNSFEPDPHGKEEFAIRLGEGFQAETVSDEIHVNGEAIYMHATDRRLFIGKKPGDVFPYCDPVTTADARISEDGTSIIYRGRWHVLDPEYRSYVNNCAARILSVIARLHTNG